MLCCAKLLQSFLTLCPPRDYNLPGSSVHGILQARILEWVAMPSSRGVFPIQGPNPGLLHCRHILYHLSHQDMWFNPVAKQYRQSKKILPFRPFTLDSMSWGHKGCKSSASQRTESCSTFIFLMLKISEWKQAIKGELTLVDIWICLPMQEIRVRSLGWEDPLEEGMATHSSILAWRIPWTEEFGGL